MPSLRKAAATLHRDPAWWRKILIGGALWLSVVGYPFVEGYQLESIDNTRNGYPVPLPRWNDLSAKAIQGIFALVIDFFYFVFPLLLGTLLLGCSVFALSLAFPSRGVIRVVGAVVAVGMVLWIVVMWLLSVSPVGKRLLAGEGLPGQALSRKVFQSAWEPPARRIYLRARLHSIPPYLGALGLFIAAWWAADRSIWVGLVGLWLALAALLYARLLVVQLYDAAAHEIQRQRYEAFRARAQA